MNYHFAVLGHPVSHSRSPDIHHQFARDLGLSVQYEAIDIPEDAFEARVQQLIEAGMHGFNVTVPHKETACQWVANLTARASRAGAVNTLLQDPDRPGQWLGDNTDGAGLLYDLTHLQGLVLEGRRVLLIGAGGAVRGVLEPLLEAQPLAVHVANRTPARAEEMVEHFADTAQACGTELTGGGFDTVSPGWDIVINGSAASLQGDIPAIDAAVMAGVSACYDMMYSADATPFNVWASAQGVPRCMDGLGMLVGQAAESFTLWTGQRPDAAPVLAALRKKLSGK
ncbi:MAG: shikimate dehydrogenase [Natronospirillum sp.]|uniref:shikimate dehydrogenase n=1 Tax=Natronospirillum sp. TaxID=2812955 RepID=UPI0025D8ECAC|nr:shikimate dehydrogenase [Natronospirillum sp.]MCH8552193.1 shikimate dehydrogenase [Natronospirillum sp.]